MARTLKAKIRIDADTRKADQALKSTGAGVGRLSSSFTALKVGIVAAVASIAIFIKALKGAVSAAIEQENAVRGLDAALAQLGSEGEKLSKTLQQFAADLQLVTKFGDEVTIQAITQIAAFTQNEQAIKALTKASQDLAEGQGISLASAASLVGRTFATSTNALTRQGLEVDALAGSTERLTQLTEGITQLYGGRAAEAAKTFEGSITQLNNAFGDLIEEFGEVITTSNDIDSILGTFTDSFAELASEIDRDAESVGQFRAVLRSLGRGLTPAFQAFLGLNLAIKENVQIVTAAERKTIDLADAQKRAIREGKEWTKQIESTEEALRALGVTLDGDVQDALEKNNRTLLEAEELYQRGVISRQTFENAERAVAAAERDLQESLEGTNLALVDATGVTESYSDIVDLATRRVRGLTFAEFENAAAVESSAARRVAARGGESGLAFDITGRPSRLTPNLSGGTFTIIEPPTVSGNGRVDP